jgi:diguanylate cyclase (GGDEF)-like protein
VKIEKITNIDEKSSIFLKLAAAIFIFTLLYFYLSDETLRHVLVYFLILIGLYFSYKLTWVVVLVNALGMILMFNSSVHGWIIPNLALSAMLIGTAAIPFYFKRLSSEESKQYQNRQTHLVEQAQGLQAESSEYDEERKKLESDIEKINHIYVLGRELVEHLSLSEIVERLQRALINRPGIKSVSIFSWQANDWFPLFFSDNSLESRWKEVFEQEKMLHKERRFRLLSTLSWTEDQAAIFWPIRIENDLLAVIFLTVEHEYVSRYLREGPIFGPQIALGFKRTKLFDEVQERSRRDGLTNLYLRRYFLERLSSEVLRAKRYSQVFSIIMADIDFFKNVNDRYGHVVGDTVLTGIAKILNESVRPGDLVCRYGGEEFVCLLPMCSPEETTRIAKRINMAVGEESFASDNARFKVTISVGVSYYPKDGKNEEEILKSSDHALYWVKSHGRNNIKEYKDIKSI